MPQASNYYSILTAVQSALQSLSPPLTDWNGVTVPIVVRKRPAYRQIVDDADYFPAIYVSPGRKGERVQYMAFGDQVFTWYPIAVSTVAAGNQDLNVHLDFYQNWRERMRQPFQGGKLTGVSGVWDTKTTPGPPFDPAAIARNYDVLLLEFEFLITEQRDVT